MVIDKLSNTAQSLIKNGCGYRNIEVYGSGVVDYEEIIKFETLELGNDDIFDTCLELYNIGYNTNGLMEEKEEDIERRIEENIKHWKNHFQADKLYGLWLTTEEAVEELYEGDPVEFTIPAGAVIVSDLDEEGILLVFNKDLSRNGDCNTRRMIFYG